MCGTIIEPDLSGKSRQRAFGKASVHRAPANICGKQARQKLSAAKLKLRANAAIAVAHAHHWTRNLLSENQLKLVRWRMPLNWSIGHGDRTHPPQDRGGWAFGRAADILHRDRRERSQSRHRSHEHRQGPTVINAESARDLYRPQRSGRPLARRRKRKTLLLSQPPALIKFAVLSPLYVPSPKADIRQRDCHVRFVPKATNAVRQA